MTPRVVSVQTGRPRVVTDADGPWATSIFKDAVEGPVRLGTTDLDGDEQENLEVHGGPDKAVCVYPADHLPSWREEFGLPFANGAFGENFSVTGQDETTVAVGDVFRVGGAVVEVSQPRGPCHKLARRWRRPDLPKRVLATRRTGWYLRVLAEGELQSGDVLALVERRAPEWTIARVVELAYFADAGASSRELAALASCPSLARSYRLSVARRVGAALAPDAGAR